MGTGSTRVKATNLLVSDQSGLLGERPCHSSLSPVGKSPNLKDSVSLHNQPQDYMINFQLLINSQTAFLHINHSKETVYYNLNNHQCSKYLRKLIMRLANL